MNPRFEACPANSLNRLGRNLRNKQKGPQQATNNRTTIMYATHAFSKRDERTWWISDSDGRNKRRVTLAQYLDEVERASTQGAPIAAAFRRGALIAA
jgi:hypothetical protein